MELIIKITVNDYPVERRRLNNILAASHAEIHSFLTNSKEDGYLANRKEFNTPYELDIQITENQQ